MTGIGRRSVLGGLAATTLVPQRSYAAGTRAATGWWRDAVIYQVYPRSFMDADGNGIGDLAGITARLDHLSRLGVDAIWLSPHFDSPNVDNGYDIRDYRRVSPAFGTMADFDRLLAAVRAKGMRLIVDLVVNHTSDEHDWFVRSRRSRDDPFRDFYIWRDGRGDAPPNNYPSFFGGPAWSRDEATGQWYLHYFHRKQPDLNWANPKVRAAVRDIARFWLAKGVAGFRMDVIAFIAKQPSLPDLTPAELSRGAEYVYASGPDLHVHLREFRRAVLHPYGAVAIGEGWGVTAAGVRDLVDARRGELDMVLSSDLADIGRAGWRTAPWTPGDLAQALAKADAATGPDGWNSVFLDNHDYPRMVSHFGDADPAWRVRSAQTLGTLLLTQRATPFVYQGDELGMTNYPFAAIGDFDDVSAKARWAALVESGKVPAAEALENLRRTSRDNARTPMQWSAGSSAGFTRGRPWLAANPNAAELNAAAQWPDPASTVNHYRRLIALRRRLPTLRRGAYRDLSPPDSKIIAYRRGESGDALLVLVNLSRAVARFAAPFAVERTPLLASAGPAPAVDGRIVTLGGWQSAIFHITSAA